MTLENRSERKTKQTVMKFCIKWLSRKNYLPAIKDVLLDSMEHECLFYCSDLVVWLIMLWLLTLISTISDSNEIVQLSSKVDQYFYDTVKLVSLYTVLMFLPYKKLSFKTSKILAIIYQKNPKMSRVKNGKSLD